EIRYVHIINMKEISEKSAILSSDSEELRTIRVFSGTFNVSGQEVSESLVPWLECDYDIDVYAIGFQETDLSAEAFLLNDSVREEEWSDAVLKALGDKAEDYWKAVLMVLVKKEHHPYIKDIRSDSAGVGLMGMMGNKGGVAIRFRFHGSYLCFVNCHLAANPGGLERRNQDYMEICRRMTFPIDTSEGYSSLYGWVGDYIPPSAKYAAAAVVGMGGMIIPGINAPNNPSMDVVEPVVKSMLEKGDMELLLNFDQLNMQRRNKQAFYEFEEGTITFPPTYKYDFKTNDFDTSEKKRSPAWTDRILWRSKESDWCKQLTYKSHMDIRLSDHKPVSSIFELKLKICPPEKSEKLDDPEHEDDEIITYNNVIILKDNGCEQYTNHRIYNIMNKSTKRKNCSTIMNISNSQEGTSNKRTQISASNLTVSQVSQTSLAEAPVGTVIQVDTSNKVSWVWKFYYQELRKETEGWIRYAICRIEIESGQECRRTYRIGFSTGNLIIHLDSEHEVTKHNQIPKKLVADSKPLNIIQNKHFQQFINAFDLAFNIPDIKLVKQVINRAYDYSVPLLRDYLKKNIVKVSFTIDFWTARNQQGYLGITCAYIDNSFKLNEVTLAIQYVQYPHTADNIYETIEKVIKYWELTNKVFSITTDNALNIKKAVKKLNGVMWQRCSAHTLQLIIGKALLPVSMLIAHAKRLINFFLRPKQSERLEIVQKRYPNKATM
ncbi:6347_t:CDS:10, partial [Scutellospora calospora]